MRLFNYLLYMHYKKNKASLINKVVRNLIPPINRRESQFGVLPTDCLCRRMSAAVTCIGRQKMTTDVSIGNYGLHIESDFLIIIIIYYYYYYYWEISWSLGVGGSPMWCKQWQDWAICKLPTSVLLFPFAFSTIFLTIISHYFLHIWYVCITKTKYNRKQNQENIIFMVETISHH